jgi:peptide/nickel transport system substrate-binding protein
MTIPIIPDEQSVLAQMRAGSVHSYLLTNLKNVATLRGDPALQLQQAPTLETDVLVFNCGKPPFDDQRLRQAFCYAVDRDKVIQLSVAGLGRWTGPLPPSMTPWGQPGDAYPLNHVDKDKARALLKEAGKDSGFETSILIGSTNPQAQSVLDSQVIADELSQVGVKVNLEQLEPTLWQKRFAKPVYDFELGSNNIIGYLGPDAYLYFRFNHMGFNQANMNNPDIEQILQQGRNTIDQDQRLQIYTKAQQMLVDYAPYMWLYSNDNYYVHLPSVQGFVPDPAGRWITASSVWLNT